MLRVAPLTSHALGVLCASLIFVTLLPSMLPMYRLCFSRRENVHLFISTRFPLHLIEAFSSGDWAQKVTTAVIPYVGSVN